MELAVSQIPYFSIPSRRVANGIIISFREASTTRYEIPATADGIEASLATDINQLTPAAVAALLLWGRHRLDTDWYTRLATPKLVTGAAP